jgi:hypothetical protein
MIQDNLPVVRVNKLKHKTTRAMKNKRLPLWMLLVEVETWKNGLESQILLVYPTTIFIPPNFCLLFSELLPAAIHQKALTLCHFDIDIQTMSRDFEPQEQQHMFVSSSGSYFSLHPGFRVG